MFGYEGQEGWCVPCHLPVGSGVYGGEEWWVPPVELSHWVLWGLSSLGMTSVDTVSGLKLIIPSLVIPVGRKIQFVLTVYVSINLNIICQFWFNMKFSRFSCYIKPYNNLLFIMPYENHAWHIKSVIEL